MRAGTRAMLLAVVLVACAMHLAVPVSAHTCYFMEVPNGWDHETRLGADVMATVLSFAAATDFRVVRFGEGADPLLSGAQFRDTVNIVGTKMATCAQANRKILINFHAQNTAKRFLRKTIVAAYLKLRADAVAHGAAALAPGVGAVVFNAFSCMPEHYTDDRVLLSYWQEVAALPAPAVHGLLLPALRDEFTTWLFGRTKAQIDVIKAARDAANAVQQCEDALAAAQHDLDVDDAAPTVPHARAFAEAQAALTNARGALTQAQLAVQNLPAAVTNLRYAAGQPVGSIADGLLVDDGHGHAVPKVLISAPWTAHPLHAAAKVACYNAYPDNAATVAAAQTAATCVLRTVYHASPDHGDQNAYGAPVLGHGAAEGPVAYRPLLQDLHVAFPDLNGHLRAIAPNANIGHKTAARILSRRVDAAAVVPNPFGPNDVMRLPNALLQYRAALRAHRRATARDLDLELDAEDEDAEDAADEEADDANADADAEADTADAAAHEADDAVEAADE